MLAVVALLALCTAHAQEAGDAYDYDGEYDLADEDRIPPPEDWYENPLRRAAAWGDRETVMAMVREGEDLDQCDPAMCVTAVYEAAMRGYAPIVRLLADAGADLEQPTGNEYTPLLVAVYEGQLDVVRVLLRHGVDIAHRDEHGNTALHLAAARGRERVLLALSRKNGFQEHLLHAKNDDGNTALHVAAFGGYAGVAQELLNMGIGFLERNNKGLTAIEVLRDVAAENPDDKKIKRTAAAMIRFADHHNIPFELRRDARSVWVWWIKTALQVAGATAILISFALVNQRARRDSQRKKAN